MGIVSRNFLEFNCLVEVGANFAFGLTQRRR